jgi:hypothetical protein
MNSGKQSRGYSDCVLVLLHFGVPFGPELNKKVQTGRRLFLSSSEALISTKTDCLRLGTLASRLWTDPVAMGKFCLSTTLSTAYAYVYRLTFLV